MKNKVIIPIVIILVVVIGFYMYSVNFSKVPKAVCGNKICETTEDCNTCPSDCGCKSNEYCSSNGICRVNVCGDGICSEQEKAAANCCEDCGCPSDKICNKFTQQCQGKTTITETQINNTVNAYLTNKSIK